MSAQRRMLLLALLVLSVLAVGFLAVTLQGEVRRQAPQPLPAMAGGVSSRQARDLVSTWTAGWQPDAGIVSCAVTYRRNNRTEEGWNCQVYAPGTKQLALVLVQGPEVRLLRETAALYPQTVLPATAWKTDSATVLNSWWQNGGQAVWEQALTEALHLRLGLNADGRPTWQITVTQEQGATLRFWELRADTGEFLQRNVGGMP